VKAETADYLAKAREALAGARQIAALPLPQVAAREAYFAAYHAAEAYIFERTGKTVKTHRGLRATFTRLAREEPRIAAEYLTFLASAYELKSIADYGVGPTTRDFRRGCRGGDRYGCTFHRHYRRPAAARFGCAARAGSSTIRPRLLPPRRFSISAGCTNRGLIVMRLSPAGPAAPAGLMIGDILIEL
jgi:uncharacterized protein (UPF0332 family)